jgi:SHS2 domain-containing protein
VEQGGVNGAMEERFTEIDHSGDIGIEARGRDVRGLLTNATLGLFSLLYRGAVRPVRERAIRAQGDSLEDLVVAWLGEAITLGGIHGEFYGAVEVREVTGHSAAGVLRGEPVDVARHEPRFDVKAATYHALSVTEDENGLCARVIFDL